MTTLAHKINVINTGLTATGHEKQALAYLEQANQLEGEAQREALSAARKEQADALQCWEGLVLLHATNPAARARFAVEQKISAAFLADIDELLAPIDASR